MKLKRFCAFLLALCLSLNAIPVHAEETTAADETEDILLGDGYVCQVGGNLWVPLHLPEGVSMDGAEISSSDETVAVASYSDGGISVKFVGAGTVVITVRIVDGTSDSMTITVEERNDPALLFGAVQTINIGEGDVYTFTPPNTGYYCFRLEAPVSTLMIVQRGDEYVTSAYYPEENSATAKLDAGVSYMVLFLPETENKDVTLTAWVETGSAPLPSHDGMLMGVDAEPATCFEDGVIEHWVCLDCGKTFSDAKGTRELVEDVTIPASHHVTKVEAKAPTYSAFGHIEHWKCEVCGWLFSEPSAWRRVKSVAVWWLVEVAEETAVVTQEAITETIQAEYKGKILSNLVLSVKDGADETVSAITVPAESLEAVRNAAEALTVEMDSAIVTMDGTAMDAVIAQADIEQITLSVQHIAYNTLNEQQQAAVDDKKVDMVISASLSSGDFLIHDFMGGKVTVKIPFDLPKNGDPEEYTILYLADDGSVEEVEHEYSKGYLTMVLDHFSEYAVVRNVGEPILETTVPTEIVTEPNSGVESDGTVEPNSGMVQDSSIESDSDVETLLLIGITILCAAVAITAFVIRKKPGK